MTQKKMLLVALLSLLVLAGCGQSMTVHVEQFDDPSFNKGGAKRFAVLPMSRDGSLEEKTYLEYARIALVRKGYVYDAQNPDFLVTMAYGSESVREYVPESTYYTDEYQPGETVNYSGQVGDTAYSGSSTTSGKWTQEAHTTGGYMQEYYDYSMTIRFIEARSYAASHGSKINPVWEGRVTGSGQPALSRIAQCLVWAVVEDYPMKPLRSEKEISGPTLDACSLQ